MTVSMPVTLADDVQIRAVEGQPLAANAKRLVQAFEFLGAPISEKLQEQLLTVIKDQNAGAIQRLLDEQVLMVVHLNPEYRVKVSRGPAPARLIQHGFQPCLVKILNESTLTDRLRISSPQAGAVYAGVSLNSMQRQQQEQLVENENVDGARDRIFELEMFSSPPLTEKLSGLEVEYAIALIYCDEAGKREATISFDVGQRTQDIGFRGELPILFEVSPAVPVQLTIHDFDGAPTTAKLVFRDAHGQIYPPQAKRLAPDFFFQEQIYRDHGEVINLAPGRYTLTSSRGPEYVEKEQVIVIPESGPSRINVELTRWVNPMDFGFYCGDHHIHGAGCAHYEIPTQGVTPQDMFRQIKGEGLNVGCILTWGPCFDFQRQYFSPQADLVSEPLTLLKYDLEISGFGSAALGHVCLLNLTDQTYPGSEGTSTLGWPKWTVPVMRWAKDQGGVTGYPHSDMRVDPVAYSKWMFAKHDSNQNQQLDLAESTEMLMPGDFGEIDRDATGTLTPDELTIFADQKANDLPNLILPSMQGSGAMEIFISTPEGVCDFISAMDTGRVGEWNTWYHLLNAGFPLKLSGETDFPCMSSRRVGQGRVYVFLGDDLEGSLDYAKWCRGLGAGRSYVSDGFAHALQFAVNGNSLGTGDVQLPGPGQVLVSATVAFAPQTPKAVAYGTESNSDGRREVGDTRILHAPRNGEWIEGGNRLVEIVVNGEVAAQLTVPADGQPHEIKLTVNIDRSSWIALRQFPQLHTNPINVVVAQQPIRASRESLLWCAESVELLWKNRSRLIPAEEKDAARAAYDRALAIYHQRVKEFGQIENLPPSP